MATRNSSTSKTTAADEADWRRAETYYLQLRWTLRVASQFAGTKYQGADGARSTGKIVTRTKFTVVVTLWSRADLSHGDLCVLTAMDPTTLRGVVEPLVRSRLVVIRIDAADARANAASALTRKGSALALRLGDDQR